MKEAQHAKKRLPSRIAYTTAISGLISLTVNSGAVALIWKQDFKSINIDSIAYKIYVLFNWHAAHKHTLEHQKYTYNLVNGSEKSSNLCDSILGLCFFPVLLLDLSLINLVQFTVYSRTCFAKYFHQVKNTKLKRLTKKKQQDRFHCCQTIYVMAFFSEYGVRTQYRSDSLILARLIDVNMYISKASLTSFQIGTCFSSLSLVVVEYYYYYMVRKTASIGFSVKPNNT